jgi:hypothetical protein
VVPLAAIHAAACSSKWERVAMALFANTITRHLAQRSSPTRFKCPCSKRECCEWQLCYGLMGANNIRPWDQHGILCTSGNCYEGEEVGQHAQWLRYATTCDLMICAFPALQQWCLSCGSQGC